MKNLAILAGLGIGLVVVAALLEVDPSFLSRIEKNVKSPSRR